MVNTYSLAKQGSQKVSEHFLVKEFACRGSDIVKICMTLICILEALRAEFCVRYGDVFIRIGSGYRTKAYNALIGGAAGSYHLFGMAADIDVIIKATGKVVDPLEVCKYLESRRIRGIGCYIYADGQSWIHVDSRQSKSFWKQSRPDVRMPVSTFWPTLREEIIPEGGEYTFSQDVAAMQVAIGAKADGKFGPKTAEKLAVWQEERGLLVDSICGPKTWAAIWG